MNKKQFLAFFTAGFMLATNFSEYQQIIPEISITADAVNESVDITLQTYMKQNEAGYTVTYGVVTAYDEGDNILWEYRTNEYEATELQLVSELGQKDNVYYLVEGGTVVALDILTGNVIWQNSDFGGAGNFAFGENAIYLCGFYGPDFYAVSYDGETLARIDESNSEYIRAYKIELSDKYATVYFEYNDAELYIDLQTYEVLDSINATDTTTATSGDFDDIHWELDSEGTLRISGIGLMPGTDYQSPWNDIKEKVKNIIIEDGVTSIGGYAFYDFTNLEAVLIPESVTSIGKYAFANCSKLWVADIPEGIEVIREGTFINCKNLGAIFFPASLKTIETDAFKNDLFIGAIYHGGDATVQTLTKKINFYSGNESITNTDAITVYQFNWMRYNGIEKKFYGKCGETAFFEFKDGIFRMYGTGSTWSYDPHIPWNAILDEIETVIVEDGITSIGRMSFSGCENLTSVTLPDTLTLIGPFAFSGCSSLSSITIPSSVTYIAFDSFDKKSLKDIYYEGSESDWNNVKFYEIDGYELITDAKIHFNNTDENNHVIANGKCGENAFWELNSNGTLKIYGTGETESYLNEKNSLPDGSKAPWYKWVDKIEKVIIEDGITYTGWGTITDCHNLISVEIADSVKRIGRGSFCNCSSLESIVIPKNVEYIEHDSFNGCYNLKTITILSDKFGKTGMSIGNWCFGGCENLDIYFNGTEEEWRTSFQAGSNSALAAATFHSIAEIEEPETEISGKCGDNVNWNFDKSTGMLTISGKGAMYSSVPWNKFTGQIKKIVVEEGITEFYFDYNNLSSYEVLESIFMPKSVLKISGTEGLENNEKEKKITICGYIASESEVFALKYGNIFTFKELNGKLALYINCEDSFIVDNSLNPRNNTFDVFVNVGNISNYYDLEDVFVNLNLPDGVTCVDLKLPDKFSCISEDKTHITGSIQHASGYDRVEIVATLKVDDSILSDKNNITIKLNVEAGAKDQPNKDSGTSFFEDIISTETVEVEKTINIIKSVKNNEIVRSDVFDFKNSAWDFGTPIIGNGIFNPRPNKKNISQEKLELLVKEMDNVVKEYVKKEKETKWNGSCFGMSRVVSLVKGGYIDLKKLGLNDISELDLPKSNSKVEDLVNFYYLQQFLPYMEDECYNAIQFDQKYLLKEIVNETKKVEKGGLPVQIDYNWVYKKNNEEQSAGHSVIGYKCECVDSDNNIVDENSEELEKYRISIYDCSQTKSSEYKPTYMYIGKEYNYWYYDKLTDTVEEDKNGKELKYIKRVISSADELNLVDYATGKMSSLCTTNYEKNFLASYVKETGLSISDSNSTSILYKLGEGKGDLYTYTVPDYGVALDENGNEIENNHYTTYFGDDFKDEDISITLDNSDECDFSMIYSNCMVSAGGSNVNKVDMKSAGAVEVSADNSDYEVSLTFNEGYYTTPWYTITASGDDANSVSMEQTKDGIVLSSDNMENVTVTANNTDETVELTFTADTDNVLITNSENNLEVYADTDDNGTYETLIDTTFADTDKNNEDNNDNTITYGSFSNNTPKTNTSTSSPKTGDSIPKVFASLIVSGLGLMLSRKRKKSNRH